MGKAFKQTGGLYQVPLSQAEIASDEMAYQDWLNDQHNEGLTTFVRPFEPILVNAELEKRLAAQRNVWIRRANTVAEVASSELQTKIEQQRTAREGATLLVRALWSEAKTADKLSKTIYEQGAPCAACGTTLRYRKTGQCVPCFIGKRPEPVRAAARSNLLRYNASYLASVATKMPFYAGAPCRKCGSTKRRTIGHHCFDCDAQRFDPLLRQWRLNRFIAVGEHRKHYDGAPCAVCGGTLRYSSNKNCVACDAKRKPSDTKRARRKERENNPVWRQAHRNRRAA